MTPQERERFEKPLAWLVYVHTADYEYRVFTDEHEAATVADEHETEAIPLVRAALDAGAVEALREDSEWRAIWESFVKRARRTVEEWDGPFPHPFAKMVREAREAERAALAARQAEGGGS